MLAENISRDINVGSCLSNYRVVMAIIYSWASRITFKCTATTVPRHWNMPPISSLRQPLGCPLNPGVAPRVFGFCTQCNPGLVTLFSHYDWGLPGVSGSLFWARIPFVANCRCVHGGLPCELDGLCFFCSPWTGLGWGRAWHPAERLWANLCQLFTSFLKVGARGARGRRAVAWGCGILSVSGLAQVPLVQ